MSDHVAKDREIAKMVAAKLEQSGAKVRHKVRVDELAAFKRGETGVLRDADGNIVQIRGVRNRQ